METRFGNFRKEGNRYILKRQYGFALVIVIGLAVMTWLGYHSENKAMMWIFGILTILCMLSVFTEKMVIDTDAQTMYIKRGLKPASHIPFADIAEYELGRVIYIFIPVNTSLNVRFISSGKEEYATIAQGFSAGAMQRILNEIEQITSPYVRKEQV